MTITRLVPISPPWAIAVTNRGPAGVGATIAVDPDVTVLDPGEDGEVVNIGNATHAVFKFSLPKGETGDVGPAPSLDIGTVTTVPNGNAADATVEGSDGNYTLNLTIPAGPDGPPPSLAIGDVESGETADAEITGGDGEYELNLVLPIGPPPVMLPGTVTAVDHGDPLVMTLAETGPGEYTLDIEVPAGPVGPAGPMNPAVYDPGNKAADAFDMANMVESTSNKILTSAERTKLAGVATGANVVATAVLGTDNVLVRSDGTGRNVQASNVTLDDTGNLGVAGTLDLGHATDTTIARDAAGKVSVEGSRVLTALKAGSPITLTSSSVDITNLNCENLDLYIDDLAVSSNGNINIQVSTNNGSSWTTAAQIAGSSASTGNAYDGIFKLTGLRSGKCVALGHTLSLSGLPTSTATVRVVAIAVAGPINAVRLTPSAGNFSGGTVTPLMGG